MLLQQIARTGAAQGTHVANANAAAADVDADATDADAAGRTAVSRLELQGYQNLHMNFNCNKIGREAHKSNIACGKYCWGQLQH